MKLNNTEVHLQPVHTKQVDGNFVLHEPVSNRVIVFNETSSFIWKMLLDCHATGNTISTSVITNRLLVAYNISIDCKLDITKDVERILSEFFHFSLLHSGINDA